MTISMTSLINTFNQLVNDQQSSVEPTILKMGSLQDHLMSISQHTAICNPNTITELSVGPPPMYRKDESTNVIALPKRQGSRVIFWSQVERSTRAA